MKLAKLHHFQNDIVLVDGMWGVGKSAVTPIIASVFGMEKKRIDPTIEYLTTLSWLRLIDPNAACALVTTFADYFTYHNAIGREVNLRISDDSGIKNSPGALRYVRRLFLNDGDQIQATINDTNPGTLLVTDLAVLGLELLRQALGSRLRFIEIMRHPLYLVNYVHSYLHDFNRPREFTLSFDFEGQKVPWIAHSWCSEFVSSSANERTLLLIARSQEAIMQSMAESDLLILPFEQFVTDTELFIEQIIGYLGRPLQYSTRKAMKRHRLPRVSVSAGRKSNSRSWISDDSEDEATIYSRLWNAARTSVSESTWHEFQRAINNYEVAFPSSLTTIGSAMQGSSEE